MHVVAPYRKRRSRLGSMLVVLGLVTLLISNVAADDLAKFARCIDRSGAKYYGAWWCPYCKSQNEMFEKSAKRLPYIECSPKGSKKVLGRCRSINAVPTWVFKDGPTVTGVQSFRQLADFTGCPMPE